MWRYCAHRIFGAPLVIRRESATLTAHQRASYVIYIPPSGKVGYRVKDGHHAKRRRNNGGWGGVAR